MWDVKLDYKEAMKQVRRELRQSKKRFASVARREIKAGGKRYAKNMARHVKKNTGIKLSQKQINEKYIKVSFDNSKDPEKMTSTVTAKRKGIGLAHFVSGKLKQTAGPVANRKSPYVRVFKGKRAKINRGFILKIKNVRDDNPQPHRLFQRHSTGYSAKFSNSVIHLANRTGFNMDKKGEREVERIRIKIKKRLDWAFESLISKR